MNDFAVLGISELEEKVYRHFLRNPRTSMDDVSPLLHSSDEDIARTVARLSELAMVRLDEGPSRTVTPVDPATVVRRLTEQRLTILHQQMKEVAQAAELIPVLERETENDGSGDRGFERLERLSDIRGRLDDLAFFTRAEICSVEPYTELTRQDIDSARPLDLKCLRRGVKVRNVVLRQATEDPLTLSYLQELVVNGAQIRVAEDITERILVFDGQTAIIPLDPDDTSRGALLTREMGLVDSVQRLFEKIWNDSRELSQVTGDAAEGNSLSPIEQQVLVSMCTVGKDEIGARDLGVSVRTYRRYVADLLRTLDAGSRAQAALLARERGWV